MRKLLYLLGLSSLWFINLSAQPQDSLIGMVNEKGTYENIADQGSVGGGEASLSIEQIQKDILAENQAFIEYSISDNEIGISFVSKESTNKKVVKKDFPLEEWISFLERELVSPDNEKNSQQFVDYSYGLYQYLIAPIEAFGLPERLLIKPPAALKNIPFGIFLKSKPENSSEFSAHDYLMKSHQISYCYSIQKQLEMRSRVVEPSKLLMTYVGGQDETVIDNAKRFRRYTGGDFYLKEDISKEELSAELPLFNGLYLLNICEEEIDLSTLNTGLLIYPSCQNEGANRLLSTLETASTQSLLSNLWNASNEQELQLMTCFFKYLYNRETKDAAFQRAQLDILEMEDEIYCHPHYWANYVLLGDASVIDLKGFSGDHLLWIIVLFLLGVGTYLLNKQVI